MKNGGLGGGRDRQRERDKGPNIIEAKVVLLGDSGVGKSSIAQRFCKNMFSTDHDVTIGGAYL